MATRNAINSSFPITPLTVANGGTGNTTFTTRGLIVYNGAILQSLAAGTNNQVLVGITASNPAFTSTGAIYVNSVSFDAGVNALSNYTISTFVPTLVGGTVAGTTTYTNQNGYYTRIGNMVFINGFVSISAATGTGDLTLGGLPFTIKNQANGNPIGNCYFNGIWTWPTGTTSLAVEGIANSITVVVAVSGSGVAAANMQMANAALSMFYSLAYQI